MSCPHGASSRWRCRPCTNTYMQGYMRAYRRRSPTWPTVPKKEWLQAAILSHLAEAPGPVGTFDLLAHTGLTDPVGVRAAIHRARRRGHPIASVKTGRTVRYRLEVA